MNSLMNITVRVQLAQAQRQLAALQAQLVGLQRQSRASSAASAGIGGAAALAGMRRWGNQVQWVGRQLQYNFALPIAIAGAAGVKFALDNEKAMTRLIKVYGDVGMSQKQVTSETKALGDAFEALSNRFGMARSDVINIGADWAAAGSSGLALAKATKLTMETMILGEMDAASATQALIAIQAQYGLQVQSNNKDTMDLSKTIDLLNMVENETATKMSDLITVMQRSAGTARNAGIDVRHLVAMAAALTPAAANATQAGTGLKTMISRLLGPTTQAADVMGLMGMNVNDLGWQSLNGAQRMEVMAKSFSKLADSQKAQVSSIIAGRYQISRFDILMEAITNKNSFYNKALNASASAADNFKQKQRELNAVLDSSPQKLQIIWNNIKNALADAIQPLLPAIIAIANSLAALAKGFANLNPHVQKLIGFAAVLLLVIGPITRYVGSLVLLFETLASAALFLFKRIFLLGFVFKPLSAAFRMIGVVAIPAWRMLTVAVVAGSRLMQVAFLRVAAVLGGTLIASMRTVFVGAIAMVANFFGSIVAVGLVQTLKLTRIYAAGMAALGIITQAARFLWIAPWTFLNLLFVKIHALAVARLAPIFARGMSALAVIATAAKLIATGPWMFFNLLLVKIWGMTQVALRGMWLATIAFLASPAKLGAALGNILKMFGIFMLNFGKYALMLGRFLVSPWGLAVAAVVGVIVYIQNKVKGGFGGILNWLKGFVASLGKTFQPVVKFFQSAANGVVNAFNKLPVGIKNAMLAVIHVVASAAKAVYKLFSYLNPFAHHSPSLVEVVTWGMAEIRKQYGSVGNVGAVFKKAASDLAAFKDASAGLGPGEFDQAGKDIAQQFPQLMPLFNALVGDYDQLTQKAYDYQTAINKQQSVVDSWKKKLDAANATLDAQQNKLDGLQANLDALNDAYSKHQQTLENFASAPIEGMKEMNDAIFDNQQAQKKLQLQMLQWEQANGPIEDMQSKLASLAGDLEALRGEATDLRKSGAGSDVLGPVNEQINAMQAQYDAVQNTLKNSPMSDLQKQLDALDKQGQILDLQNSIKFDPLKKQIDDLANAQKELPFDQIIQGIKDQKAAMAELEPQIAAATAAVDKQKAAVDSAKAARDAIQGTYDAESKKLDALKDQYSEINNAIQAITDSLNSMGTAANAAIQSASGAGGAGTKLFPGADFPDVGGQAGLGREGIAGDQSFSIEQFAKDMNDQVSKAMGGFGDMFKPIKDGWNKVWGWIKTNLGPVASAIWGGVQAAFQALGAWIQSEGGQKVIGWFKNAFIKVGSALKAIFEGVVKVVKLFWPDIKKVAEEIGSALVKIWQRVGPTVIKFINQIKPLVEFIAVVLLRRLKIAVSIFANVLGPVIDTVIGIFDSILNIIGGFVDFVYSIFTGKWGKAWDAAVQVVKGVWNLIYSIIGGFVKIVWGVIKGFVDGMVGFFQWLYDVLVGHSIIPDLVNAIVTLFQWMIAPLKAVWDAVWAGISWLWNNMVLPLFEVIKTAVQVMAEVFQWVWDNIISPAWNLIWDSVKAIWESVGQPLFDLVKLYIQTWAAIFKWIWDNVIKPAWNLIWSSVKAVWNSIGQPIFDFIKGAIQGWAQVFSWIWDNAIKPAWNFVWDNVKKIWYSVGQPVFDTVKGAIHTLGTVFTTVKDAIVKAWDILWSGIQGAWNNIGRRVFETIANGAISIINVAIMAINALIRGFNLITGLLHIGFKIDTIPHLDNVSFSASGTTGGTAGGTGGGRNRAFAQGGQLPFSTVGSGFITNRPRAIVGEGGSWPEYVIPTDPRYRSRAAMLFRALGGKLNMLAGGGTVGGGGTDIGGALVGGLASGLGSVGDLITGAAKAALRVAVKAIFWPLKTVAENLLKTVPIEFVQKMGTKLIDLVWNWIDTKMMASGGIIPQFAQGGIATRPTAGIFGEAGHEVLAPLTPLWNKLDRIERFASDKLQGNRSGDVTININGDLSFPNIKSGGDAEDFLRNLETLAGR